MNVADINRKADRMTQDDDDYSLAEVVRIMGATKEQIQQQLVGFGARFDNYLLTAVYRADVEKNAVITESIRADLATHTKALTKRLAALEDARQRVNYMMLGVFVAAVVDIVTRVIPAIGK